MPGNLFDALIIGYYETERLFHAALDENGRISFNLLQHHRSKAQAMLFYVFDVLAYPGRSLLNVPLSSRRERLNEIFNGMKAAAPIALSESLNASADELVRVAKEFGFEGASSPSARIPSTSQENESAHGSSTGSTGVRSSSSAPANVPAARKRSVVSQTNFLFMTFPSATAMGMPQIEVCENRISEMENRVKASHSCYRGSSEFDSLHGHIAHRVKTDKMPYGDCD
jgi:hypothetical protein